MLFFKVLIAVGIIDLLLVAAILLKCGFWLYLEYQNLTGIIVG